MIFSFYNWRPVELTIWENMVLETKVPMLVLLAFLLGFVPVLAYHLSVKWALKRRIRNLENSLKTLANSRRNDTPATSGDGGFVPVTNATDSKKSDTPDSAADGGFDGGSGGDGGGE